MNAHLQFVITKLEKHTTNCSLFEHATLFFLYTLRKRISSSTYANKQVPIPSDVKSKLDREGNLFSLDNFDPTTAQGESELHKEIKKVVNAILKESEQQEKRDKRKTAKLSRISHSQTFEALDNNSNTNNN